ncbi:MAG: EF-P lysine aminoacylase GenX [Agarilytica sp.]
MWQPGATLPTLQRRAALLANLRRFFFDKKVLEVDVPLLGASTVTDVHLSAPSATIARQTHYLQTSPEFFMKRLLAAGSGDVYYLGKAVRDDEVGRYHNPEFTMLEWYRLGYSDARLIDEVCELFRFLSIAESCRRISYRSLFLDYYSVDPHLASAKDLEKIARSHMEFSWEEDAKSTWLDLLFSHGIEPNLQALTVVYDYPECQSALAKVSEDETGTTVAKRFEVFWRGIELANGYWELTDADLQRARFEDDLSTRKVLGMAQPEIDEKLMAAMKAGLPECAGIALGVDRLLLALTEQESLDEVMPFSGVRL